MFASNVFVNYENGELGELFQKKRSTLKHTLLVHIMEIKYLCKPNVIFSNNEMHVNCI